MKFFELKDKISVLRTKFWVLGLNFVFEEEILKIFEILFERLHSSSLYFVRKLRNRMIFFSFRSTKIPGRSGPSRTKETRRTRTRNAPPSGEKQIKNRRSRTGETESESQGDAASRDGRTATARGERHGATSDRTPQKTQTGRRRRLRHLTGIYNPWFTPAARFNALFTPAGERERRPGQQFERAAADTAAHEKSDVARLAFPVRDGEGPL